MNLASKGKRSILLKNREEMMRQWCARILGCGVLLLALIGAVEASNGDPVDLDAGPVFYEMLPPFTINVLTTDGSFTYMLVRVELMLSNGHMLRVVRYHEPRLRNSLVKLFSIQSEAAVRDVIGQQKIRKEASKLLKSNMKKEGIEVGEIQDVLFTQLLIE